ncbi:hypothetical protein P9112_001811 [Eukaryota sp. TZLM1-RC]
MSIHSSVYQKCRLPLPDSGEGSSVTCSSWHSSEPIIAVGSSTGFLYVFRVSPSTFSSSEPDEPIFSLSRPVHPTSLLWHPTEAILIVGWQDGSLTILNTDTNSYHDASSQTSPISSLTFSPALTLFSACTSGTLAIWSLKDERLISTSTIRLSSPISTITPVVQPLAPASTSLGNGVFVGCNDGWVHLVSESGEHLQLFSLNSSIIFIGQADSDGTTITLTSNLLLSRHQIKTDGQINSDSTAQLSTSCSALIDAFFGDLKNSILLTITKEQVLRLWSLSDEGSFSLLSLLDPKDPRRSSSTDRFNCASIEYGGYYNVLFSGTEEGRLLVYNSRPTADDVITRTGDVEGDDVINSPRHWDLVDVLEFGSCISNIKIGRFETEDSLLFSVVTQEEIILCRKFDVSTCNGIFENLVYNLKENIHEEPLSVSVIQQGLKSCEVLLYDNQIRHRLMLPDLETVNYVSGVATNGQYVVVFDSKNLDCYKLEDIRSDTPNISFWFSLSSSCHLVTVLSDSLIISMGRALVVYSLEQIKEGSPSKISDSKVSKKPLEMYRVSTRFGTITSLSSCGSYLTYGTSNGYVGVLQVDKLDYFKKQERESMGKINVLNEVCSSRNQLEYSIRQVVINRNASNVGVLVGHDCTKPVIYVMDTSSGLFDTWQFDLFSPVTLNFDYFEPSLLTVQVEPLLDHSVSESSVVPKDKVCTLFVTNGIHFQSFSEINRNQSILIGSNAPYFHFVDSLFVYGNNRDLELKVMSDFEGLEKESSSLRGAIISFSKNLCMGNLEKAFKSVLKIDSSSAWASLVVLCIKARRLDVARTCLSKMGNVKTLRVIRRAEEELRDESTATRELVCLGLIAAQLLMYGEAETYFFESGKFKYLIELYCAQGRFEDAITVAQKHSKISLSAIFHKQAQYFEFLGDLKKAKESLASSGNSLVPLAKLYYNTGNYEQLRLLCEDTTDLELGKWWGKYLESVGQYDDAISLYESIGAFVPLTKLLCSQSQIDKAIVVVKRAVVENSKEAKAAAYNVAGFVEQKGELDKALDLYKIVENCSAAYRLAKRLGNDQEVLGFALNSSEVKIKIDGAQYFEAKNKLDSAILLYQKANLIARALDLCIKGRRFSALRDLIESLPETADPSLYNRVAEYCLTNGEMERAVELLTKGKRFESALELAAKHGVKLTDQTADSILKELEGDERFTTVCLSIAELLEVQGAYNSAAKRFIQAGKSKKAMACLVRSGATDKVVSFALASRKVDLYIAAGNYLQTLDWRGQPKYLEKLVNFYLKAKAYTHLASFYESSCTYEIDEYRDYDKGLASLTQAKKCWDKAMQKQDVSEQLATVKMKLDVLSRFVKARDNFQNDPHSSVSICMVLLDELDQFDTQNSESRPPVRQGDVLALLVEYYRSAGDAETALKLIEQMKERELSLTLYLDEATVNDLVQEEDVGGIAERIVFDDVDSEEGEGFIEEEI